MGAVGTLQANESVVIRSEIAGRVQTIHFAEGQAVARNIPLLTIDPVEYQAQYDQAEAALGLSRLNFDRSKPLYEQQLLSQQAYDELAAKFKEAEANLAVARARLDKTKIQAPFSGRLGLRQVSPGDYLQPGQAIVNLEDLDPLKVDFRVPEAYVGRIKDGGAVQVGADAMPDRRFKGTVYAIDPRIDAATRTLVVRARVPNADGRLRPGMFVRVGVVLAERPRAVLIPEQAIVPVGNDTFVYRIVDGKAALTKVTIGQRREGEVEIVAGLGSEETVITGGQNKPMIFDGAPVMVIPPGGGPAGPPAPAAAAPKRG
ncbi:MAG: efflux RND transporter periplasmic adaptor subunit [Nitrospirae bacterium]|nr:efflux RND transporter periplasmic adaptor subunit [Nitrospirota bacterium]